MRSRSLCRGSDEAGAFVAAQGLTAGPAFRKAELLTAFYIYDFVVKSCPFESRDFEQNHREAEKSVKIRKKRGCKRLFLTAILYINIVVKSYPFTGAGQMCKSVNVQMSGRAAVVVRS